MYEVFKLFTANNSIFHSIIPSEKVYSKEIVTILFKYCVQRYVDVNDERTADLTTLL